MSSIFQGFTKVCTTDFGRFKIKVDSQNIAVGGKNFCVNIALRDDETSLYWLGTEDGGCELNDKLIKGPNTVRMVDLAFSLLRQYYPDRTIVTLFDDSGFSWRGKKNKKFKIQFLNGYLLLHRKTWYEEKFNAKMINSDSYKEYRYKADHNFDDPTKKPAVFDFIDPEAKQLLTPIYQQTNTWGEFIDEMVKKYDNTKYFLMYEWYRNAIYHIFDGIEIHHKWKIDVTQRPIISCNTITQNGGKKTRKRHNITFSNYDRIEPFYFTPNNL